MSEEVATRLGIATLGVAGVLLVLAFLAYREYRKRLGRCFLYAAALCPIFAILVLVGSTVLLRAR